MHVALFGGSFDPPHLGHVLCATYAYAVGEVDAVWVLPVHIHPYGKTMRASWADRLDLCLAAFAGFGFVQVRDDEERNPEGRTIDLVAALRRSHPDTAFSLIGGTDTHEDLVNWYRGPDLIEQVTIIPVPRSGFDDDPTALPAISSSGIQERMAAGQPWEHLVPRGVATLIRERRLYR